MAQPQPLLAGTRHIQSLINGFTVETTPRAADKISHFGDYLRTGTAVYVTFLPGSDFTDTVRVCKRLHEEGFVPIPHFAARSINDEKQLEDYIRRVVGEADVSWVLCIAGAVDKPLGTFSDSMQILQTGLFEKHGIHRIAVAGHPEGSPDMSDAAIMDALTWKNNYRQQSGSELYLVTQFAFDIEPILNWEKRLIDAGITLPVHIGLPGLATLKSLLMHAKACGVGPSMRVLTRQARNVTRLLVVNTPDKLLRGLAHHTYSHQNSLIAGVHMYPLGGLRRSAQWSYAVQDGELSLSKDGFNVHPHID